MSDLRKGLISERKLKLIIITQLDEHHSLSSIFTNYIYYDRFCDDTLKGTLM